METPNTMPPDDPQLKELVTADLPADLKKKIAMEYWRLKVAHPNWKVHKAMKRAGEKFNVKFEFE